MGSWLVMLIGTLSILSLFSGAAMMLAELAMEAGLPKGVLNIVHGTNVSSLIHSFLAISQYHTRLILLGIVYTNLHCIFIPDYCDFLLYWHSPSSTSIYWYRILLVITKIILASSLCQCFTIFVQWSCSLITSINLLSFRMLWIIYVMTTTLRLYPLLAQIL